MRAPISSSSPPSGAAASDRLRCLVDTMVFSLQFAVQVVCMFQPTLKYNNVKESTNFLYISTYPDNQGLPLINCGRVMWLIGAFLFTLKLSRTGAFHHGCKMRASVPSMSFFRSMHCNQHDQRKAQSAVNELLGLNTEAVNTILYQRVVSTLAHH